MQTHIDEVDHNRLGLHLFTVEGGVGPTPQVAATMYVCGVVFTCIESDCRSLVDNTEVSDTGLALEIGRAHV